VHRHQHKTLGSIYAYRAELESWWIARSVTNARQWRVAASEAPGTQETPAAKLKMPTTEAPHLLALPFETIYSSTDSSSMRRTIEIFAGGLRDDLVVELSRRNLSATSLPVKAMPSPGTSSLTFVRSLASEFAADIVLSGSIRAAGAQVRVSVQLTRASDMRCIWSDRFDAGLANLLDTQEALAKQIGNAVSEHTVPDVPASEPDPATEGEVAHHACIVGFHFWNRRSKNAIQKALTHFKDALELDPKCAQAYAGVANVYISLSYNHLMPARQAAIRANKAVQKALELDPKSVAVRNAAVNVLLNCTWDWSAAERECRSMVDSGEMDGRTLQLYSSLMSVNGRHEEAVDFALRANRIETDSVAANTQVSHAHLYAGDYESALPFIVRALELTPNFVMGHALLGRIEAERGNWDSAVSAFSQIPEGSDHLPFAKALLAYAYAGGGEKARASAILNDLDRDRHDKCFPAYDVSAAQSLLNLEDRALQNICHACETRDMKTIFVKQDSRFARLRHLPGFPQLAPSMSFC